MNPSPEESQKILYCALIAVKEIGPFFLIMPHERVWAWHAQHAKPIKVTTTFG